jgi:hypothetical protein
MFAFRVLHGVYLIAMTLLLLNRAYNETATDIADIVNYHAAPVTVITGAKASNLEKGPKKVWAVFLRKHRYLT